MQYNYSSKREWTENILSTEDSRLFRKCVEDTYVNKKTPDFTDGMYLYEVNNKLIISDGNFNDPSIDAVVDFNVSNATNMNTLLRSINVYGRTFSGNQTSNEFLQDLKTYINATYLSIYQKQNFRSSNATSGGAYPTRQNGYQDFGYSREQRYGGKGNPRVKEHDFVNEYNKRRVNNESVSKGHCSNGLSARVAPGYDNNRSSNLRRKSGEELSADQGESADNEGRVSPDNGDRGEVK